MTETKDPIKREKLHSYLSSNDLTDLNLDDFSREYSSNSEKLEKLHSYLSSEQLTDLDISSFSKEYFGDLKKKDSTSQDQKLASGQEMENGSSATPPDERGQLVKDIDSGKFDSRITELQKENEAAKKESDAFVNDLLNRKKNDTVLSVEDFEDINNTLKEENQGDFGFFGNIGNYLKSRGIIGGVINPFFSPENVGNKSKAAEIRNNLAKEQNIAPEDVDTELVNKSVLEERRSELIEEKEIAKTEEFIEELTLEEQTKLKNHFGIKKGQLSNKSTNALLSIENKGKEIEDIDTKLQSIKETWNPEQQYPESYYNNNIDLAEKRKTLVVQLNNDITEFGKTEDDLLGTSDELDLFKRNYNKWDNFTGKLGIAGEELVLNLGFLLNKGLSLNPTHAISALELEHNIIQRKEKIGKEREGLRKSKSVSKLNTWEDASEWALDLVAEQTPNTILMATTGSASLPLMAATATGGKLFDLEQEERETGVKIDPFKKYASAFITGAAEALTEKISLGQINKAKRVFRSVSKKELKDNTLTYLKNKFPEYIKDIIEEGSSESLSQLAENITDKYLLGKDISLTEGLDEAFVSGAFMSGVVYKAPGIAKALTHPFTPKDVNQKVGENFSYIMKINEELKKELKPTTKIALEDQKENLLETNKTLVDKTISNIDNLSKKDKGRLLAIENETYKLRKEAQSINKDNLDEKTKESLLKDIKSNIENLDEKKEFILNQNTNESTKKETPETKTENQDQSETQSKEKGLLDDESKETAPKNKEQEVETITPKAKIKSEKGVENTSNPIIEYIDKDGNTQSIDTEKLKLKSGKNVMGKKLSLIHNKKEIGYINYKMEGKDQANISIASTSPEIRRRGIGTLMYEKIGDYLFNKGITLNSDSVRRDGADGIWLKLKKKGLAVDTEKGYKYVGKVKNKSESSKEKSSRKFRIVNPFKKGLRKKESNETQTKGDIVTDGNFQTGIVEDQQQREIKNIQSTTNEGTNNSPTKVKEYSVSDSDKAPKYKITFKDGNLNIKDSKGKEPSAPTRRKLLDKYSDDVDFTTGKRANETNDQNPETHKTIAETSENPSEIAEALTNIDTPGFIDSQLDYKDKVIAENIGLVGRQSFIDNDDVNNINNSLAKSYLRKDGRPLDTIAQEISDDYGIEVTEQDLVDFIKDNPNRANTIFSNVKSEHIEPLKSRFTQLTGLPANSKYLQKALDQQDARENNFSVVDILSEEELISLLNERKEAEQNDTQINPTGKNSATGESSTQNENRSRVRKKSKSDGSKQASPKEIDDTTQSQGISSSQTQRDLTGKGKLVDKFSGGRAFKKFWNNTFKSNQGLDSKNGEVVRSKNRDIAAFTDALNYETKQFKKLLNKVKRSDRKNFTENSLKINDYLAGDKVDVSFLTTEQKKQLDYFRDRIDGLSDKLVTKLEDQLKGQQDKLNSLKKDSIGYISVSESIKRTEDLIETIKSNKKKYLNRSYQIFVDDSYSNKITLAEGELGIVGQNKIDAAVNYLVKEEGYSKEDAKKYIAEYLDAIKRGKNDLNFISNGKANAPFLKKRKDIPKAFRELLGEANDPIYNYVNTVYKLSGYIANLEYQQRLRGSLLESGVGVTEPKQGYTKLTSDGDGWQTLSDIYVPNDVKQAIEDMAPLKQVNDKFYANWLKFVAFTKFGKTIASPTTAARNLISGVFLGANSGHLFLLNPKHAATAFNSAWDTKKSFTKLKEERQKLIKLGVLKDGGRSGELMATLNDFSKETSRMVKSDKYEMTLDFLKKVYSFGDDFYKASGFYIEKDRFVKSGMSESNAEKKAAERINGGYPTYSYVPRNFQHIRRIPLFGTFVSFPYEVFRTTTNNAKYVVEDFKEGRTAMAAQRLAGMIVANGILFALSEYTRSMIGFDDEDDDAVRDMLPKWQENSKLIYLGTKNGKPLFIDGTAIFPSETIFKPIQTLLEQRESRNLDDKVQSAIGEVINPFVSADISTKTMIELFKNKNQYDKKIYKGDNLIEGLTNDPDKIAHYYMRQAGIGAYNNLTEFMRANNIAPEYFGDKFTSYGREYTNRDAMLALAGFRLSTINFANGISSVGYDIKDEYEFKRDEIYTKLKSTQKLSDSEADALILDYEKANKEIYGKMLNIVDSGRKLGLTDKEIASALKYPGFSKKDIRDLLSGNYPDLKPMSKQSAKRLINKIKTNYKGSEDKAKVILNNFSKKYNAFNARVERYNKKSR